MSTVQPIPTPFLDVRVHDLSKDPGLTALCAGYESNKWRADQLAAHLIEWLPEFALTQKDIAAIGAHNLVRVLTRAAQVIYTTPKKDKRGEIGELLLHIAIRQVFGSLPAISKFYFKDSANNTVKGFDAVHVVATATELDLWLGEVKFYMDIGSAITDVAKDVCNHTNEKFLRQEFALILNKIDDTWPYADRLKKLLDKNTSLDDVFDALTIPVFLSFESPVLKKHSSVTADFVKEFETEVRAHYGSFCDKPFPNNVRIHLFLFPMQVKQALVNSFDAKLKACQSLA